MKSRDGYYLVLLILVFFVVGCKKNTVNPDELISIKSYYRTNPVTGDTVFAFHIPTGFTPNNDLMNEYWEPKSFGLDSSQYFINIFDKSGKVIFESSVPAKFYGRENDEPLPEQTFGYFIEAKDKDREEYFFKGKFILLK